MVRKVIEGWVCPQFRIQLETVPLVHEEGNHTVRVIQIPKMLCPPHTGGNTGGFQPILYAILAKITFLHNTSQVLGFYHFIQGGFSSLMKGFHLPKRVPGTIGTGENAVFAADAFGRVNQNQPIVPSVRGSRRADLDAFRIIAVHAVYWKKADAAVRVESPLKLENPVPEDSWRDMVGCLAGNGARLTSDTPFQINNHSVSQGCSSSAR